jgi:hypothetical protein
MSKERLAVYLNDHLAGSVVALEILERLETEAADLAPDLRILRTEVERDRDELKSIMGRLGILQSRVRKAGSWIVEQLGEVKLEVDDDSGGPLRRLERLEAVALGIEGKAALWSALNAAAEVAPDLRGPDYGRLGDRAKEQRNRVEVFRREAARTALTT